MSPQSVTVHTQDDVDLIADWYHVKGSSRFAILLHQRSTTKESWSSWASALNAKGVSCLAIDERGSGKSTAGGTLNYREFTEADYLKRDWDVAGAFEWLQEQEGATEQNTVIIGASVGANLALRFLAAHPGMPLAIALSPGKNYFGVTTEDALKKLAPGQKAVLVASDDDRGVLGECKELAALAPDRVTLVAKSGLGHGTGMTDKDPGLIAALLAYLA